MEDPRGPARGGGERLFAGLGRAIARHPWYPVIFWILVLLITLPFLSRVGSVTTNSATALPASSPSALAQNEFVRLFPNQTAGSSSVILLTGANITGTIGQRSVLALSSTLQGDRSLQYVESVSSLYSTYASYLAGEAQVTSAVVQNGLGGSPSVVIAVNESGLLLWGPPAMYVALWQALVLQHPGTNASMWNYPAYNQTQSKLASNSSSLLVLAAFYNGYDGTGAGFNGSSNCALNPQNVVPCADGAARTNEAPLIPFFVPLSSEQRVPKAVLSNLGIENFTTWSFVQATATVVLNETSGVPASWILRVWNAFPRGVLSLASALAWTDGLVANGSLAAAPLPVPYSISSQFVDSRGTATLLVISFTKGSGYTNGSEGNPIFSDVREINRIVPQVLRTTDPSSTLTFYQTGGAALDENEQADLNQSLSIVLPLTVFVLIIITMLYFRAPLTPVITFGGLGIALILGLGGVVLVGTFVTQVDPTALTLEETFVLGVGTDYSIFLVARYREELLAGRASSEALVTSVTWAGQSIATSGSTAIIATLALAFSGIALLSQWGIVLSLAIFITVMMSLTLVPAFLAILGPRVFWPSTKERFRRQAARTNERMKAEQTYFYRVGRLGQRRPKTVVGLVLLASVPLLVIALQVPLSYDFYQQLPSGQPASNGLAVFGSHFGAGAAFTSYSLVTFESPLLVGNSTNSTEFNDLAALTTLAATAPGVQSVQSPIGPYGAALATWLSFSGLPVASQTTLGGVLASFVGTDVRTVVLNIQTIASGLSLAAVRAISSLESDLRTYAQGHPEVRNLAFGGSAPLTNDLAQQTLIATERMVLAVSIGLVVVLLAVLRSWMIPLMAVATIGLSIGWAWAITYLVFGSLFGLPLFFYVPTVLFILILGLGIDYNIFLLTRVREERLRGRSSTNAAVEAVARTGGIISAAAVILASAFAILTVGNFTLLRAIGFAVATAIVLDAMIVRTFLVPSALHLLGDRVWSSFGRRRKPTNPYSHQEPPAETSPTHAPTSGDGGPKYA